MYREGSYLLDVQWQQKSAIRQFPQLKSPQFWHSLRHLTHATCRQSWHGDDGLLSSGTRHDEQEPLAPRPISAKADPVFEPRNSIATVLASISFNTCLLLRQTSRTEM